MDGKGFDLQGIISDCGDIALARYSFRQAEQIAST
jgi:hypothetical protein